MSTDGKQPQRIKTDFVAHQAAAAHVPLLKQGPVLMVLVIVALVAAYGLFKLVNYLLNADKIEAMKNVEVSFQKPFQKDGLTYIGVEIDNYNPAPIQETTFQYTILGPSGQPLKSDKLTISPVVPAGDSRIFSAVKLGTIPTHAGRMKPELIDLKYGPQPSLSAQLQRRFVDAAGMKPQESLDSFMQVVKEAPEFAPGYIRLGQALAANNDLDNAVKAYQKAIACDPDNANAHYNLGVALYYRKDLAGAGKEFQAALKLEPDDPAVLDSIKQMGPSPSDKPASHASGDK